MARFLDRHETLLSAAVSSDVLDGCEPVLESIAGSVDRDNVAVVQQTIKDRCEQAVTAQQQIAATVKKTAATIRSGAMDSVSGKTAEELQKRDVWSDWSKSKEDFAKLQKADTDAAVKRQADEDLGPHGGPLQGECDRGLRRCERGPEVGADAVLQELGAQEGHDTVEVRCVGELQTIGRQGLAVLEAPLVVAQAIRHHLGGRRQPLAGQEELQATVGVAGHRDAP